MTLFCVRFFDTFAHVFVCAFVVFIMSSSTLLGSVGEFDPSSETFTTYFERLEQFFEANSIGHYPADATSAFIQAANRKKVAVMISVISKNTYGTLHDLCSPENPKDKTFDVLHDLLLRYW